MLRRAWGESSGTGVNSGHDAQSRARRAVADAPNETHLPLNRGCTQSRRPIGPGHLGIGRRGTGSPVNTPFARTPSRGIRKAVGQAVRQWNCTCRIDSQWSFDARYLRSRATDTFLFPFGQNVNPYSFLGERETSEWNFPLMLKYRFKVGSIRPFISAGHYWLRESIKQSYFDSCAGPQGSYRPTDSPFPEPGAGQMRYTATVRGVVGARASSSGRAMWRSRRNCDSAADLRNAAGQSVHGVGWVYLWQQAMMWREFNMDRLSYIVGATMPAVFSRNTMPESDQSPLPGAPESQSQSMRLQPNTQVERNVRKNYRSFRVYVVRNDRSKSQNLSMQEAVSVWLWTLGPQVALRILSYVVSYWITKLPTDIMSGFSCIWALLRILLVGPHGFR
jgi:hypothetical protein